MYRMCINWLHSPLDGWNGWKMAFLHSREDFLCASRKTRCQMAPITGHIHFITNWYTPHDWARFQDHFWRLFSSVKHSWASEHSASRAEHSGAVPSFPTVTHPKWNHPKGTKVGYTFFRATFYQYKYKYKGWKTAAGLDSKLGQSDDEIVGIGVSNIPLIRKDTNHGTFRQNPRLNKIF